MNDKLLHSLACASITCVAFVSLLVVAVKVHKNNDVVSGDGDEHEEEDEAVGVVRHDHEEQEQQQNQGSDVESASSLIIIDANNDIHSESEKVEKERAKRRIPMNIVILAGISGILAMCVGVAKELFDASEILWKGGTSSWGDILADFIGVVLGEILIFGGFALRSIFCNVS